MPKKFDPRTRGKNDPTDLHVGVRVRMRRKMLHMSQTQLADAVDLTFQQIQKYEKGSNRIGSSRLQQFSNILQVPISFFFEGLTGSGTGQAGIPAVLVALFSTNDGLKLAASFQKIKRETPVGESLSWSRSSRRTSDAASLRALLHESAD